MEMCNGRMAGGGVTITHMIKSAAPAMASAEQML
jgi:hypothetical protein